MYPSGFEGACGWVQCFWGGCVGVYGVCCHRRAGVLVKMGWSGWVGCPLVSVRAGGLWVGCMLWVCRWGSGAVSCGVGCWCQVGLGLVEESSSMVLLNGMGFVRVGLVGAWIGSCLGVVWEWPKIGLGMV